MPLRNPTNAGTASRGPGLRFQGFPSQARDFFEALDREPCPDAWPGGDRAIYAVHVLSPLKALVGDLGRILAGVAPPLGLEPRVGASLSWPERQGAGPRDCPVRQVRIWDGRGKPDDSPLLYASFAASGIEVGLSSGGADPGATARVRRALLESPGGNVRRLAASLLGAGWKVSGEVTPVASVEILPADLRLWVREKALRVFRQLPWEPWIGEPAFAGELADRFRELLPLFDVMRLSPDDNPGAAPRPRAARATGDR